MRSKPTIVFIPRTAQRRGPKVDTQVVELARLQDEDKRLREKLKRAELIMDVQKKLRRCLV